jgi:hypothetical protein
VLESIGLHWQIENQHDDEQKRFEKGHFQMACDCRFAGSVEFQQTVVARIGSLKHNKLSTAPLLSTLITWGSRSID